MKDLVYKISMWLGRKFLALLLSLLFLIIGAIFKPDKLAQIAPAVVGLYSAFVLGHATTDVMASKNAAIAAAGQPGTTTTVAVKSTTVTQEDAD